MTRPAMRRRAVFSTATATLLGHPVGRQPLARAVVIWQESPLLVGFAAACLALAAAATAAAVVDPRRLAGEPVWAKPAKFGLSLAVFALTWQWGLGLVHADQRDSPALHAAARTLVAAAALELTWITGQAARGEASHHNTVDPLHTAILAVMGVGAVVLIATDVPLAWAIARHPAPGTDDALRLAAVLGLGLTTVLGGAFGVALGAHGGHTVGADAGEALPVVGWRRGAGDLRVAHFLALHAAQGLPLAAAALVRCPAPSARVRLALVVAMAAAWAAGAIAAFAQARAGRAFPFG